MRIIAQAGQNFSHLSISTIRTEAGGTSFIQPAHTIAGMLLPLKLL